MFVLLLFFIIFIFILTFKLKSQKRKFSKCFRIDELFLDQLRKAKFNKLSIKLIKFIN